MSKIIYTKKCPECEFRFETGAPQTKVPIHLETDTTTTCPGSEKDGIEIGRRVDTKEIVL